LLISLREPGDAMEVHERQCFAERARIPIENLHVHCIFDGVPDATVLRSYDAILFGGSGAFSVLDDTLWIRTAITALMTVVELRVPAWASCFGFQGLGVALGGTVERDEQKTEMGSVLLELTPEGKADPLLSALPARFWAQEGHHDRVVELPAGVTLLARGEEVEEQAFKVDGAPFWASQFHPELRLEDTLLRFRHYSPFYLHTDEDWEARFRIMEAGKETPEMSDVLARLVRGAFSS
jgi:GMP synthase (glutamine-hydrolysing)